MTEGSCERARGLSFDHRRGELDEPSSTWLEQHLLHCSSCREHRARLDALLDAPREEALEGQVAGFDTAALFERIGAEISGEEPAGYTPLPYVADCREVETSPLLDLQADGPVQVGKVAASSQPAVQRAGLRRWRRAAGWTAIAAAAAILLLLRVGGGDGRTRESGATCDGDLLEVPSLSIAEQVPPGLVILESKGASWSFGGDRDGVLVLERGTVLVEYDPALERGLRVVGPSFEVEVVGTIFLASAEGEGEVAVLRGEVDVRKEGRRTRLGSGQRIGRRGEVVALAEDARLRMEQEISSARVPSHAGAHASTDAPLQDVADDPSARPTDDAREAPTGPAAVERRPAGQHAAVRPGGGPAAPAPEPELSTGTIPSAGDGWSQAEAAMASGDWTRAAAELERLLQGLPAGHEAEASLRLDLARLYADRLGLREEAAAHLQTFLERWPQDVAAGAARRRLERLQTASPPVD
ncbi:MAG: zf-HC2 domain-containing protein [Myxococcota bacterium]